MYFTKNINFFWIICLLVISQSDIYSQIDSSKSIKTTALPIVYYLPETGFAFGGAGISTFKLKNEYGKKISQVQFGAAYTQKKQILLFLPFEIYTAADKNRFFGELAFYKYFYNYYGNGINSRKGDLELYKVSYPKFGFSYTRKLNKYIYAGASYNFARYNMPEIKENGLLANAQETGFEGGTISAFGVDVIYDSRDNLFYPSKGMFVNLKAEYSGSASLGSFTYNKYQFDIRHFISIVDKHIIATQFRAGASQGNLSIFEQFYISSPWLVRGFSDRRFRDNNLSAFQAEYRFPIYWRISGVAFAGAGTVAPALSEVFSTKYRSSYGVGLRFNANKKENINLRVDYALTQEGSNFYLTVKEAF